MALGRWRVETRLAIGIGWSGPDMPEARNMGRSLDAFVAEIAAHPEGFDGLFRRMGYVFLLPLLGFPYPEVAERLVTCLADVGVSEAQAGAVSLRELVGFALRCASQYWASLAVEWLEAGFPLGGQLAEAIDLRVAEKQWSQQERHRAFRLVRRWERRQGEP